jgi:hypothetical protein
MNAQAKIEAATLSAALVKALAEIGGATKDKINPAFKSKYADLSSVIDAIKPVLARHDLAFEQHSQPSEDGVIVETIVRHASGDTVSMGSLYVPANKRDAQGFGSALTYCRRYALMTAFGVPAEDDDGNAAVASARATPKPVPMITDEQRSLMTALIPAAGKTVQEIVEAFNVSAITELTEAKAASAIARLQALAKELA